MCGKYDQCDPWTLIAADLFDVPYQDVTKEQRKLAKQEGFRLMYSQHPINALTGDNDGNQD